LNIYVLLIYKDILMCRESGMDWLIEYICTIDLQGYINVS